MGNVGEKGQGGDLISLDLVFLVCKFVFVDLEFIGLWSFSGADTR